MRYLWDGSSRVIIGRVGNKNKSDNGPPGTDYDLTVRLVMTPWRTACWCCLMFTIVTSSAPVSEIQLCSGDGYPVSLVMAEESQTQ